MPQISSNLSVVPRPLSHKDHKMTAFI
ncbi:hypothetical protein THICB2_310058 [Thiomonas sp. CB2]|nr:hypothetical protein THICB2_310058 [Thiomonas sp. CB2]CQR42756.1 hypothetical protein THICB3300056 [Thiomonas sp. CB3]VDY05270.1 protein of unknown function [Thiomonas sp. Bio17B3]VDY07567.1 protein of unknown function [Thiomonas sp. Sup16B3]VDY13515.1 conserved protein of unknown function [Thiomonas sp. OC7]